MPVNVGDAVLTFIGDTTQLDQAFTKVGVEAATKMPPAAAEVANVGREFAVASNQAQELGEVTNLAGEQVRVSMYEAKGELGLLGEQFGVHLPRHVRSFVAELPGVGEALTAAFSATAVLFLIEALVKITEKMSDFIAKTFIFTKATQEAYAAGLLLNKTFIDGTAEIAKLDDAYAKLGKTKQQILVEGTIRVEAEVQKLEAERRGQLDAAWKFERDGDREAGQAKRNEAAATAEKIKVFQVQERNDSAEFNIQKEKDDEAYAKKVKALTEKLYFDLAKSRAELGKELEKQETQDAKIAEERLKAQLTAEEKAAGQRVKDIKEALKIETELTTEAEQELSASVNRKAALYARQYATGAISGRQYLEEIRKLYRDEEQELIALINKKELLLDRADAKYILNLRKFEAEKDKIEEQADAKIAAAAIKMNATVTQAVNAAGSAFLSAAAAFGAGSETIVGALQKIAAATIMAIAQEAEVQGAKQTAIGIADLAPDSPGFGHSGEHFLSAAEWFGLAGALAIGGGALSGGGGGGSSSGSGRGGSPINTSPAAATQATVATSVNVQRFATGGLVTGPTLAIVGDNPSGGSATEAIVPLDGPEGRKFGGDTIINIYNKGNVIDHKGLMKQISRQTKNYQGRLQASDTYRNTKRG
jgi:hypothetical protein